MLIKQVLIEVWGAAEPHTEDAFHAGATLCHHLAYPKLLELCLLYWTIDCGNSSLLPHYAIRRGIPSGSDSGEGREASLWNHGGFKGITSLLLSHFPPDLIHLEFFVLQSVLLLFNCNFICLQILFNLLQATLLIVYFSFEIVLFILDSILFLDKGSGLLLKLISDIFCLLLVLSKPFDKVLQLLILFT